MADSEQTKLTQARDLLQDAWRLRHFGQLKQALPNADQALKLLDDVTGDEALQLRAECFITRASIYQDLDRGDDASRDYNKVVSDLNQVIELNPKNAKAYHNRGNAFSGLQHYNDALQDYGRAIEIAPDNAVAYQNRGGLYIALQNYEMALSDFNQVIELEPNNAESYSNRGGVHAELKDYEKALSDLNHAVALAPQDARFYYNRGGIYAERKDYDNALRDYNKAIEIEPNYVRAYNNRGRVYGELKDYDRALADCNQAIRLDRGKAEYHHNRAVILALRSAQETERKLREEHKKQLRKFSDPLKIIEEFEKRKQVYRDKLTAGEGRVEQTRKYLRRWLFWCAGIVSGVIIFVLCQILYGQGDKISPWVLIGTTLPLTVLTLLSAYPFFNALKAAQNQLHLDSIVLEDIDRKKTLMRYALMPSDKHQEQLITMTHAHFANRSPAELLAGWKPQEESPHWLERIVGGALKITK